MGLGSFKIEDNPFYQKKFQYTFGSQGLIENNSDVVLIALNLAYLRKDQLANLNFERDDLFAGQNELN